MADSRKLERVKNNPGVYRKHANGCKQGKSCGCPYVVRWAGGKRFFPTLELAREFKGGLSGKVQRRPLSAKSVAVYWHEWFPTYRGRTRRGLTESTKDEYAASFKHHIEPLRIAKIKVRDLGPPEVRVWCEELERRGVSPRSIKHAKIALGLMFACALEDGTVASNPVQQTRYIPSPEAQRAHAKPEAKRLTARDVLAILEAMPEAWRAFFSLLAHSGMRIGELLGLTWANVHLGDDPHLSIVEQVYKGKRKEPKWGSVGEVPLSPGMAACLAELKLRTKDVRPEEPVFPSKTGTALTYANVLNRVLRPARIEAGIAVKVGEVEARKRDGTVELRPVWDYQGVAFHAFRHACGSLLVAHGKQDVQVQGWLRHAKLSTTHDVYIHPADDGLGGAEILDEILPVGGQRGAIGHPEAAAVGAPADPDETPSEWGIAGQPKAAEGSGANS